MFVEIIENRSGETLLLRQLSPTEYIDPEYHLQRYCETQGIVLSEADGYIPSGCGDLYCETRDTKAATGCCWSSCDAFIKEVYD